MGCYRLLYPYGTLDVNTAHRVEMEVGQTKGRKTSLPMPDPEKDDLPEEDVFVFQERLELDAFKVFSWLRENGKTVVVEINDWLWDLPKNAPARHALKTVKGISVESLERQVRCASLVTVSTPKLAELVSEWNPEVHVLPNFLRRGDWTHITPSFEKDRRLRIGWMGRLAYRGDDLDVLRGVIGPWLERNPDCVFVQVGDEDPDVVHDAIGVPKDQRLSYQGQTFPRHSTPTSMIDIGVVPLEPTVFNESKSHLKGMEYAACGSPCIASPTGPYREWIDGSNGILAKTPKDWFNALDEMKENWREMGRNAHKKVQGHMIDERWVEWQSLYDSISDAETSSSKGSSTSMTPPSASRMSASERSSISTPEKTALSMKSTLVTS